MKGNLLAERLANYRTQRGISQRDVAELLGVSQPTVGLIERGVTYDPHLSMLRKLIVVLRLTDTEIINIVRADKAGARTQTSEVVAAA